MGGKRISKETKEKVLELLIQGHRALRISKQLNLTHSVVKSWQYLFDGGDTSWVDNTYTHYANMFSEDEKVEVVKSILSHSTAEADASRKLNVSLYTLNRWVFNYTNYGACTLKRGRPSKKDINDRRAEKNQRVREIVNPEREISDRKRERKALLENILPGLGRRVSKGNS